MAISSMSLIWLVLFVCISQIHGKLELPGNDAQWEVWKNIHNKNYENEYVENYRKAIWQANLEVNDVVEYWFTALVRDCINIISIVFINFTG